MSCLSDDLLLALAEGQRPLDAAASAHLAICDECRQTLAMAARARDRETHPEPELPPPEGEPSWDELGPGVTLGGGAYVLERRIGEGGMGAVFSARRTVDGSAVAIKIARSRDPELAKRFAREAEVSVSIAHPNVLRVFGVLPASASLGPCIVQEYLEGETLASRLEREGSLSLRVAARVLLPVASALQAAHDRGVVHRDVKPSNVFLTASRVVVLDFGVAKLLPVWGEHSRLTRSGAVLGTLRYMAPEQVFGVTDVDARADVWALGALLYRAITGRDAVEVDALGPMVRLFRERAKSAVVAVPPELPANVAWLLSSALAVDRDARISDMRPWLAVLSTFASP